VVVVLVEDQEDVEEAVPQVKQPQDQDLEEEEEEEEAAEEEEEPWARPALNPSGAEP